MLLGTNGSRANNDDFMSFSSASAFQPGNGGGEDMEVDFERLVKGNVGSGPTVNAISGGWDSTSANTQPRASSTQTKPGMKSISHSASFYLTLTVAHNFGNLLCHRLRLNLIPQ